MSIQSIRNYQPSTNNILPQYNSVNYSDSNKIKKFPDQKNLISTNNDEINKHLKVQQALKDEGYQCRENSAKTAQLVNKNNCIHSKTYTCTKNDGKSVDTRYITISNKPCVPANCPTPTLGETITASWNNFKKSFNEADEYISGPINRFFGKVGDWFSNAYKSVKQGVGDAYEAFAQGAREANENSGIIRRTVYVNTCKEKSTSYR